MQLKQQLRRPEGWDELTFLAWEDQKGICPICGKRISLLDKGEARMIGHHITPRSQGGKNTRDNCEARHASPCEVWAHQESKTGNPTKSQIDVFRMEH